MRKEGKSSVKSKSAVTNLMALSTLEAKLHTRRPGLAAPLWLPKRNANICKDTRD
jgi:hypothetical protein